MDNEYYISLVYREDKKKLEILLSKYNKGKYIYKFIDEILVKDKDISDAKIYELIKKKFNSDGKLRVFDNSYTQRGNYRASDYIRILKTVQTKESIKTYLDIGIGDGEITNETAKILSKLFKTSSFGIDIVDARNNKNGSYVFKKYDGVAIPFSGFDLVTMSMILHHIEKLDEFVINLYKCMNVGGIVIVRDHDITNNLDLNLVILQHRIMNRIYTDKLIIDSDEGKKNTDGSNSIKEIINPELYENFMSANQIIEIMKNIGFIQLKYSNIAFQKESNITKYIYLVFQKIKKESLIDEYIKY